MGEAKRRRDQKRPSKQPSIEAGWESYNRNVLPLTAPDIQRSETRMAFWAGASTLFFSIMDCLDEGNEPTDADLKRMDNIAKEIRAFTETFDQEVEKRRPGAVSAAAEFLALPPEARLGDAPVEQSMNEKMKAVVRALDLWFNGNDRGADRRVGFVLLTFPFGDTSGRANFMSNGADRRHIVALFKEMIARFEGQPEIKGHA